MKLLSHLYLGIQRILLPELNEEMGEPIRQPLFFCARTSVTRRHEADEYTLARAQTGLLMQAR